MKYQDRPKLIRHFEWLALIILLPVMVGTGIAFWRQLGDPPVYAAKLDQGWTFCATDAPLHDPIRDGAWQPLRLPVAWSAYTSETHERWTYVRTQFELDAGVFRKPLAFVAGRLDETAYIIVNGTVIPVGANTDGRRGRETYVPVIINIPEVLRPGLNDLVVASHYPPDLPGFMEAPLGIAEASSARRYARGAFLSKSFLPLASSLVLLVVGATITLFSHRVREVDRWLLPAAAACLGGRRHL